MSSAPREPLLFNALERHGGERGDGIAVDDGDTAVSFRELLSEASSLADRLGSAAGRRVAVSVSETAPWIATMAALDRVGASAFLFHPDTRPDEVERIAADLRLDARVGADGGLIPIGTGSDGAATDPPGVTLLTSGTTGKPKAVQHTWDSLASPVRSSPTFVGTRWLLAYPIHLYAGLQVFLQCFLNGGTLVTLPAAAGPEEVGERLLAGGVQYASATPSFWRRLIHFGRPAVLRRVPLRQLTLGGEPASEEILRALRDIFPDARVVHIYATSELGRCFSVTDGHAGFPRRFLDDGPEDGIELRIIDGELHVRSKNRMARYDPLSGLEADMSDWFPTGDLVETVGDRVLFRGRRTDMINVGGNKVYPLEVERVIGEVEGVAETRVHPIRSSIVGEMVAADVVPLPGTDAEALRAALIAHCLAHLLPHQRPRKIDIVTRLELSRAGKIPRSRP